MMHEPTSASPSADKGQTRPSSWHRFGKWGLFFSSIFVLTGNGTCPCCGQPACPIGFVGTGVLAAACTSGLHWLTRAKQKKSTPQTAKNTEAHGDETPPQMKA